MLRRAHSRRPAMHRRRGGRKMRGRGVLDWIKKAGNFIANGLISKGASLAAKFLPAQYSGIANTISSGAKAMGLGRRRHRRGAGLTLAGAGYHHCRRLRMY